jgi:hypothetical protein
MGANFKDWYRLLPARSDQSLPGSNEKSKSGQSRNKGPMAKKNHSFPRRQAQQFVLHILYDKIKDEYLHCSKNRFAEYQRTNFMPTE